MSYPKPLPFSIVKGALFVACLAPLGHLACGIAADTLGANPVEAIIRGLGDWGLRLLLLTLALAPLRRLTGWAGALKLRRMFGLYAFFYALLHVLGYVWMEQFFDWGEIVRDIAERPFITVGFTAFVLLIPLAATSTNAMMKRLGGKRWQQLHRLVYPCAVLVVLHYWWMVKADLTQPAIYATLLAVLLGERVYRFWGGKTAKQPVAYDNLRTIAR